MLELFVSNVEIAPSCLVSQLEAFVLNVKLVGCLVALLILV